MRVYKYPLQVDDIQNIQMPKGAKVLSIQVQLDIPCMWALVNPAAEMETRIFQTYGTGQPMDTFVGEYVGTYQVHNVLVYHVFDITN